MVYQIFYIDQAKCIDNKQSLFAQICKTGKILKKYFWEIYYNFLSNKQILSIFDNICNKQILSILMILFYK